MDGITEAVCSAFAGAAPKIVRSDIVGLLEKLEERGLLEHGARSRSAGPPLAE